MKQKTIRFYGASKADMAAYELLKRYRDYGFNNEREFIIAAIVRYSEEEDKPPDTSFDIDQLANMIADKLYERGFQTIDISNENGSDEVDRDKEAFDKALSFIEEL